MADDKKIKKTDDPFELLNELANVGKKKKSIKISDNLEVVLETLSADDEARVFAICEEASGSEYFSKNKRETIIHSLFSINGKSLKGYKELEDVAKKKIMKGDTLEKIRDIVNGWNDELITFLYAQFTEMISESEKEMVSMGILKPIEELEEPKEETKEKEEKEETEETSKK